MKSSFFLFGFLAIFACLEETTGMKCYVCNYASDPSSETTSDPDCENSPLPDSLLKECSQGGQNGTYYCLKRYIKDKGDDEKFNINRDCAVKEEGETELRCQKLQMGGDKDGRVCHCDTEGCNGADYGQRVTFTMTILIPCLQLLRNI